MLSSHLCFPSLFRTEASQHNSGALLNTLQFYRPNFLDSVPQKQRSYGREGFGVSIARGS